MRITGPCLAAILFVTTASCFLSASGEPWQVIDKAPLPVPPSERVFPNIPELEASPSGRYYLVRHASAQRHRVSIVDIETGRYQELETSHDDTFATFDVNDHVYTAFTTQISRELSPSRAEYLTTVSAFDPSGSLQWQRWLRSSSSLPRIIVSGSILALPGLDPFLETTSGELFDTRRALARAELGSQDSLFIAWGRDPIVLVRLDNRTAQPRCTALLTFRDEPLSQALPIALLDDEDRIVVQTAHGSEIFAKDGCRSLGTFHGAAFPTNKGYALAFTEAERTVVQRVDRTTLSSVATWDLSEKPFSRPYAWAVHPAGFVLSHEGMVLDLETGTKIPFGVDSYRLPRIIAQGSRHLCHLGGNVMSCFDVAAAGMLQISLPEPMTALVARPSADGTASVFIANSGSTLFSIDAVTRTVSRVVEVP